MKVSVEKSNKLEESNRLEKSKDLENSYLSYFLNFPLNFKLKEENYPFLVSHKFRFRKKLLNFLQGVIPNIVQCSSSGNLRGFKED